MQIDVRDGTARQAAVAVVTGIVAVSLAVASALHLASPADGDRAGVAEAVICAVLAVAAVGLWRMRGRARTFALCAIGFAIAGFCVGLSITARGGHWADIAYHVTVLPVLVGAFVALQCSP